MHLFGFYMRLLKHGMTSSVIRPWWPSGLRRQHCLKHSCTWNSDSPVFHSEVKVMANQSTPSKPFKVLCHYIFYLLFSFCNGSHTIPMQRGLVFTIIVKCFRLCTLPFSAMLPLLVYAFVLMLKFCCSNFAAQILLLKFWY